MSSPGVVLSVVIVSWNTKKLVYDCLESLLPLVKCGLAEVLLVDNASSDGTQEMVRERFPRVKLVENDSNLGFSRANNAGLALCSGKYVALINSDVVVPAGCLDNMIAYMDAQSEIGMLGPKMILPDGHIGSSCMRFPSVWNWFCEALALPSLFKGSRLVGDPMMRDFKYDRITEVDVLTGWFWLVRATALRQVGFLDDRFFMYGEDIDWPKRFHECGWKVVFYSEAYAIHHCAGTSAKSPVRFYVEMYKANMQYVRKHHGLLAVIGFWMAVWLHQAVRLIGHSATYVLSRTDRDTALYKVKRSFACLNWMFTSLITAGRPK
jgi:GT2 family glycosyltransferase